MRRQRVQAAQRVDRAMHKGGPFMRSPGKGIAMLCVLCVAACTQAIEDKAVRVEREKTVQRYDNFLAAASNGQQLASAGGNCVLVTSTDGRKRWTREVLPSSS